MKRPPSCGRSRCCSSLGGRVLVAALWAALFGAAIAAFAALLVSRVLPVLWGAGAGITVALFPSQIVWSSVVLRESMVWAALGAAALGIALFAGAKSWPALAGTTVLVGASLLALAYLRDWVFLPAAWATAMGAWLSVRRARSWRVALAWHSAWYSHLSSASVLPGGPMSTRTRTFGTERDMLSLGAKSAIVHPEVHPPRHPGRAPKPLRRALATRAAASPPPAPLATASQ